jgi:hypothetical protein
VRIPSLVGFEFPESCVEFLAGFVTLSMGFATLSAGFVTLPAGLVAFSAKFSESRTARWVRFGTFGEPRTELKGSVPMGSVQVREGFEPQRTCNPRIIKQNSCRVWYVPLTHREIEMLI